MDILHNSIWRNNNDAELPVGLFRVLYVEMERGLTVLYFIKDKMTKSKPITFSLKALKEKIDAGTLLPDELALPPDLFKSDAELPSSWLIKRDENWRLIKGIAEDLYYLLDLAMNTRSKIISKYIDQLDEPKPSRQKVLRLLAQYWTFGQTVNALLPKYCNVGNRGKQKAPAKNGRAGRQYVTPVHNQIPPGKPFTEDDKTCLEGVIKRYYLSRAQLSLAECFDKFLIIRYADEVKKAAAEHRPAIIPTIRQFKYWVDTLYSKQQLIVRRKGESYYQGNVKQLKGSSSADTFGAGSIYQIDATTADVYLVDPRDPNKIIGRPTIYCVIDVHTRLIVGSYIGMLHPSWETARIALWYTFNKKMELCNRVGIEITDEQWPSFHLPKRIVVDRGELIGNRPELSLPSMGVSITVTAPYRGDMKAIVEKRFDIFNQDIHTLDGTTKGKLRKRDEKNPCLDANLTLAEFSRIIIKDVLHHNLYTSFDDLCNDEFYQSDFDPTPVNVWQYCVNNHIHELTEISPQQLYPCLLEQQLKFHLTRYGLEIAGRRYTSDEFRLLIDRAGGQLPPDCSVKKNRDETNYIYFRADNHSPYLQLALAQSRKHFGDKTEAEVVNIQHWLAGKKMEPAKIASRLDKSQDKQELIDNARVRSAQADKVADAQKLKNIRENRHNAEEVLSFPTAHEKTDTADSQTGVGDEEVDEFSRQIDDLWDDD